MKTILVPTDFSKAAVNATEYAIHLANRINAKIVLLNVYDIPIMPYTDVPVVYPMPQELHQDAERLLEKQVQNIKRTAADIDISFKAIMGLPVNEIAERAKEVDFIVMGMSGAGKLSELLIGSVATAVIKTVEVPVFLIPENVTFKNPSNIVLATDYSLKTGVEVLEPLKQLIQLYNSKLSIVNIKRGEDISVENIIAEGRVESKFSDIDHCYYFPENEDLIKGLNEFIIHKEADLLVIMPHRYNWLEGLFHRRNSKKIAFHTHIALLALPDKHTS